MTEERGEEGAGVYGRPPTLSVCTAAILPMLLSQQQHQRVRYHYLILLREEIRHIRHILVSGRPRI